MMHFSRFGFSTLFFWGAEDLVLPLLTAPPFWGQRAAPLSLNILGAEKYFGAEDSVLYFTNRVSFWGQWSPALCPQNLGDRGCIIYSKAERSFFGDRGSSTIFY